VVDRDTAQARFEHRLRDPRHLDGARTEEELWGSEVLPLDAGYSGSREDPGNTQNRRSAGLCLRFRFGALGGVLVQDIGKACLKT
jgi:hypothetical protein